MIRYARQVMGWALAALCIVAIPSSSRAADKYCPQGLMGVWNGIYYYWSKNCATPTPTFAYVTDNRMHTCGLDCPNPIDPIYADRKVTKAKKNQPMAAPAPGDKFHHNIKCFQKAFVHERGGDIPGVGTDWSDENGTCWIANPNFQINADEYLFVKDKDHKTRYFRVLTIELITNPAFPSGIEVPPQSIRIGQELEKEPTSDKAEAVFFSPSDSNKHHTIKKKGTNWIFYVTSKDDLVQP